MGGRVLCRTWLDNTVQGHAVVNEKGKGAQNYLDVMSYLSTGMKHGISVFDALTAAFAGNGTIVLQ